MGYNSKHRKMVMRKMRGIYYNGISSNDPHKDFMGYDIDEMNFPTYHHIVSASSLRKQNSSTKPIIENGAYLGDLSHNFLHSKIELYDLDLFNDWNNLFMKIVEKQDPFNDEINKEREELQRRSQELSNILDSKKLTLKPKKNIQ